MTNILLISNSLDNINIAWRHFRYEEYSANATTNIDAAIEQLKSDNAAKIVIYYCGDDTETFYPFYKALRSDPDTAGIPLLILSDVSWQQALTGYVKFYNTSVIGNSVNDEKLKDIVRMGAKYGFEEKGAVLNRPAPRRPEKPKR